MNRHVRKTSSKNSFSKALILGVILIIALLFYKRISEKGLPQNLFSMLEQESVDPKAYTLFAEEQKDSVNRAIAGFWTFNTTASDSQILNISDRIELKDNGIIWRTREFGLAASADTIKTLLVSYAYIRPFSFFKDNSKKLVCEARIIREALITGSDTCFSPGNVDEVWILTAGKDIFELDGRKYVSYGNADLTLFFPEKALDIIDMPFKSEKKATPKEQWEKAGRSGKPITESTGIFALKECEMSLNELAIVRNSVMRYALGIKAESKEAVGLVSSHFIPLCMDRLMKSNSISNVEFNAEAVLLKNGTLDSVKIHMVKNESGNSKADEIVKAEVATWVTSAFTDCENTRLTFTYRSPDLRSALPAQ
jgi:hypothetical protein